MKVVQNSNFVFVTFNYFSKLFTTLFIKSLIERKTYSLLYWRNLKSHICLTDNIFAILNEMKYKHVCIDYLST